MYTIHFDDRAIDILVKFDKELRKRIYNKIISTKENPFHFFERLEGRKDYKLRIGDYRVIADIDRKNEIIWITLIGHRKNVYDKI
jgi:mRNA interferase RelE/StbE